MKVNEICRMAVVVVIQFNLLLDEARIEEASSYDDNIMYEYLVAAWLLAHFQLLARQILGGCIMAACSFSASCTPNLFMLLAYILSHTKAASYYWCGRGAPRCRNKTNPRNYVGAHRLQYKQTKKKKPEKQ